MPMAKMQIVQSAYHSNGSAAPFHLAIVDDADSGETKIVVMFDEQDYTAVLSLDTLISDEDISAKAHQSRGAIYDDALRNALWYPEGLGTEEIEYS